MNAMLPAEDAESLLAPYLKPIADCLREAVDRFNADRAVSGPVSTRTRASNVHDYASEAAERTLDGMPGITLVRDHGFLVIVVRDAVNIRFKKLTKRLGTCGIPTRQARLWDAQEQIPGMPPVTYLVAGYVLDDLGEISRLVLVCSRYGRVMWTIDLDDGYGEDSGVLAFRSPDNSPQPERVTVRSSSETREADQRT